MASGWPLARAGSLSADVRVRHHLAGIAPFPPPVAVAADRRHRGATAQDATGGGLAQAGHPPHRHLITMAAAAANATTPALPMDLRLDYKNILRGPHHLLLVLGPEIVRNWRGGCLTIRHP